MKRLLFATILAGCAVHTTFSITLGDGTSASSSANATGSVNNAGFLTLDDAAWSFTMNLEGLAPGDHAIASGAGELQIARADAGETFATSVGGTCDVWLDAHGATNGSPITGHFTCVGLASTSGATIDVTAATFDVELEDPANNPLHK